MLCEALDKGAALGVNLVMTLSVLPYHLMQGHCRKSFLFVKCFLQSLASLFSLLCSMYGHYLD